MRYLALLVEQEPYLAKTLSQTKALLAGHELSVLACESLTQALQIISQHSGVDEVISLVILGVGLSSPHQIARKLYAHAPKVQLLFWCKTEQYASLYEQLRSPVAAIGHHWQLLSYDNDSHFIDIGQIVTAVKQRYQHQKIVKGVNVHLAQGSSEELSKLQRFALSLSFLNQIFADAHDAIIVTTADGIIVRWNNAAQRMFGLDHEQAFGRSIFEISSGKWHQNIANALKRISQLAQDHLDEEIQFISHRKQLTYVEVSLSKIKNQDDNLLGFSFILHDITERKLVEFELECMRLELEQLSFLDQLTGIANRRKFDVVLQQEWSRAARHNTPLSLMMIDVDYFKQYNDHYGHQQGDICLKKIAKALTNVTKRTEDLVARYGGEEFVILLPGLGHEKAYQLAQHSLDKISQLKIKHECSKVGRLISISVGLYTSVPSKDKNSRNLIEMADRQLYLAKHNGRARVEQSYE